ncbi:MAG: hypothetical protein WC548_04605 [Candidatus Pacearchaeota archaeon]
MAEEIISIDASNGFTYIGTVRRLQGRGDTNTLFDWMAIQTSRLVDSVGLLGANYKSKVMEVYCKNTGRIEKNPIRIEGESRIFHVIGLITSSSA